MQLFILKKQDAKKKKKKVDLNLTQKQNKIQNSCRVNSAYKIIYSSKKFRHFNFDLMLDLSPQTSKTTTGKAYLRDEQNNKLRKSFRTSPRATKLFPVTSTISYHSYQSLNTFTRDESQGEAVKLSSLQLIQFSSLKFRNEKIVSGRPV